MHNIGQEISFLGGLVLWSADKSNYWTIPVLVEIHEVSYE